MWKSSLHLAHFTLNQKKTNILEDKKKYTFTRESSLARQSWEEKKIGVLILKKKEFEGNNKLYSK